MYWICLTPGIISNTNSCYAFLFLHNFKVKTKVTIDQKSLLVTELNKFAVIGLI